MKYLSTRLVFIHLFIGSMCNVFSAPISSDFSVSLHCARIRDELTISLGETEIALFEVITVVPKIRRENLDENVKNVAFLLAWPVLEKTRSSTAILFPTLKPLITVTSGKVKDVTFRNDQGVKVETSEAMTANGFYRIEIEFGTAIPKEFTVVISMTAKRDSINNCPELLCKMSDDGMGQLFTMPESKIRVVDNRGSHFVFDKDNVEKRADVSGWISTEIDVHYNIRKE